MKGISSLLPAIFLLSAFSAQSQFKNVKVNQDKEGQYPAVEPSVAISPANTKNIIIGTGLNRVILSKDGGLTWLETELKSPYGVIGDPVITSDHKGNFYYFHLADPAGKGKTTDTWLDRIVCQRSEDGGMFWSQGTFTGFNHPKDNDKPWAAIHPKKDFIGVTWTQFDEYGSQEKTCQSNILFSKSTNQAEKWSEPVKLNKLSGDCMDDDLTAMGAVPYIDFSGRIFVTWAQAGVIYLDRSFDQGETWLRSDITVARQLGGWNITVPGHRRSNGLPVLQGDHSGSPYNGSLYVVYADQRLGEDTDIWFIKSPNRGDNWSEPIRVGTKSSGHQYMPWMAVDQSTGHVYIVYYSRHGLQGNETDVYMAWSVDGGSKFNEVKISETPFIPDELVFFGDYLNISAYKGTIVPVWTRMDNGKTQIMTTIIQESDLPK
ncbi:MAG: glycosyl hydrolase [Cyclobacteriaceae bacterium]